MKESSLLNKKESFSTFDTNTKKMLNPQASCLPMEDTLLKDGDTTGFREADLLRNHNETVFSHMLGTGLQEVEMQELGVQEVEVQEVEVRSREMKAEIIDLEL
jgi:hypothetical protein